ncbi:helix-turn-helix domain-containing protein [Dactylosporangium sp. CA-092794]|uniref:PucR family transcriptional regulator n=1 Tax=Dactylosporangium sp. CA-092794 TaxID=3239929 RepID=UPI003D8ADD4B
MTDALGPTAVQLAGAHLLDRLDELVEQITAEVWRAVPAYNDIVMERDALEQYVRPNIQGTLEYMRSGRDIDDEDRRRLEVLGRSRALQGVPQAAMIQSFRIAERALVDAFCVFCIRSAFNSAEQRSGIQAISAIMDRVERTTFEAYLDTQRELELDRGASIAMLVTRLVDSSVGDQVDIDTQARLIGANPAMPYRCIALTVLPGDEPADPTGPLTRLRRHIQARLREARVPSVIAGLRDNALLLLLPVTERDALAAVRRAVTPAQARMAVVGGTGDVYPSLFEARDSCRQAIAALEVAVRRRRQNEVVGYGDVAIDVMLLDSADASRRLIAGYLGNLEPHPVLVQTIREYLRQSLSVQITAERLTVHVNTIAYRLRRVRELTGHDLRKPDDAVGFSLALRAQELLEDGSNGKDGSN